MCELDDGNFFLYFRVSQEAFFRVTFIFTLNLHESGKNTQRNWLDFRPVYMVEKKGGEVAGVPL